VLHAFSKLSDEFEKYNLLMDLYDSNEKLFFMLLQEHLELLMPVVYTPTVATACLRYGELALRTR
jgi:malic enzyme